MLKSGSQTLRRVRFRNRTLRAPVVRLRHRGLTPNDALLASYPRSGTTWLRFLLFETLTREPSAFGRVRTAVPSLGAQRGARPVLAGGGRLVQTHEPYCDADRRVVYVVRDARSVLVSEYKWQRFAGFYAGSFERFFLEFLDGRTNPWGSWAGHVAYWRNSPAARNGHLQLVRYEDLRRDTHAVFSGVLDFLGVERDPDEVARAIAANSLEGMRAKEDESRRRRGSTQRGDMRFINTGSVKGWQDALTAEQLETLERRLGETMRSLGYDLVTSI
jgi:hypothetical protein